MPNPAANYFEVQIDNPQSSEKDDAPTSDYLQVSLLDSQGNILINKITQGRYTKIEVPAELKNGIYFVKIFYEENIWTKQLIVRK